MRKEKITSQELKRLIALKANKLSYDDVSEEDFDEITELVLKSTTFNGENTGIDLNCIALFPNIEMVRVIGFDIEQEVIDVLTNQLRLHGVEFSKCKMGKVSFEGLNGRLKRVDFTECGRLDFKYPEVQNINVVSSEVDFNNIDFEKVKGISIIDSVIRNGKSLTEFEDIERVVLDGTKIYAGDEEKTDIEVSKNTKYSHKKEVEFVDIER